MALIIQIKVGGTTYDIGVKAGNGIAINASGAVEVYCGSGLRADNSGLCVLISGHSDGFRHGLQFVRDEIAIKIAPGLKFNDSGAIAIDFGSGLTIDTNGKLVTV
jgi:hypothetical protein